STRKGTDIACSARWKSHRIMSAPPGRLYGQQLDSRPNNFPAKLPTYCHQKRNLAIGGVGSQIPFHIAVFGPASLLSVSLRFIWVCLILRFIS
ncbi:MAG: hypothetical protein WCP30_04195, partial [Mycobacteriaceae bacterium]